MYCLMENRKRFDKKNLAPEQKREESYLTISIVNEMKNSRIMKHRRFCRYRYHTDIKLILVMYYIEL